jgi:hypothetical protein
MPVSNMENMNTKGDLENVLSTVMERLKTVSANSVDLSAFSNKGDDIPDHLDYDEKKNKELEEEKNQDINTDTKKQDI